MDNNVTSNPNDNYNILLEEMKKAIDKHMPLKTVTFGKYRHKKETWITSGILKSIRYKDKLYKQLKMTNPMIPQYNILKTNLKTYSTILKRNIRLAKKCIMLIYTTKIDGVVCPPNISETVAVRTVKLAHRPRIASTTIKFISKPI